MTRDFLYHYTDLHGLLGIAQSKQIYATNVGFLNDSEELRFGLTRLLQRVDAQIADAPHVGANADDWRQNLRGFIIEQLSATDRYGADIYVACFCTNGDLLSQWRGYGAGGGYALGFDTGMLKTLGAIKDYPPARLSCEVTKVSYGLDRLDECIAGFQQPATALGYPADRTIVRMMLEKTIRSKILETAVAFKHESFEEEKEHRLIVMQRGEDGYAFEPDVRAARSIPTPYVKVPLPLDQILGRIIVGPGPGRARRQAGVQALVRRERLHCETASSSIPFRA